MIPSIPGEVSAARVVRSQLEDSHRLAIRIPNLCDHLVGIRPQLETRGDTLSACQDDRLIRSGNVLSEKGCGQRTVHRSVEQAGARDGCLQIRIHILKLL